MNEFDIIARYFAPLATAPGAFRLGDDAAVIPPRPGFDLVVTTDQIAEGTDFFKQDSPATVAKKALRVNLSDLAAKGAVPLGYLLTMALPADRTEDWLAEFAGGLAEDQGHFGVSLLGGDMAATKGPLSIGVTAFGHVPEGMMLRRDGARVGDTVFVTGTIGDSGGGLALLLGEIAPAGTTEGNQLVERYRLPQPPVSFGPSLRGLATATIDVSDGLIADLGHIASASKVGIALDAQSVPRSQALRALWGEGPETIVRAATAGDDYQIAFTADPVHQNTIRQLATVAGIAVTPIGRVVAGESVALIHDGQALAMSKPGYRHF